MTKNISALKVVISVPKVVISVPNFRPFLRKYQENPNLTLAPKLGKSTDRDQNLISSESGHDTSTCQISDRSTRSLENVRQPQIWSILLS